MVEMASNSSVSLNSEGRRRRADRIAEVRLTCCVRRTRASSLMIRRGLCIRPARYRVFQFSKSEQRLSTVVTPYLMVFGRALLPSFAHSKQTYSSIHRNKCIEPDARSDFLDSGNII